MQKQMMKITADTKDMDAAILELKLYVERFSTEARDVLSDLVNLPMEMATIEHATTVGALATYRVKPNQWFLDLLTACRTGDFNWIIQNGGINHDFLQKT